MSTAVVGFGSGPDLHFTVGFRRFPTLARYAGFKVQSAEVTPSEGTCFRGINSVWIRSRVSVYGSTSKAPRPPRVQRWIGGFFGNGVGNRVGRCCPVMWKASRLSV